MYFIFLVYLNIFYLFDFMVRKCKKCYRLDLKIEVVKVILVKMVRMYW